MEWAWYRSFGGTISYMTPELKRANRRIALRAWLLVLANAAVVCGVLIVDAAISASTRRQSGDTGGAFALLVLAGGFVVFIRILSSAAAKRTRNRSDAAAAARVGRVFGTPGGIRAAAHRFGSAQTEAGAVGEEATAVLLDLLLSIPGTSVFHGLQFPYDDNADVDHAVYRGNVVFLIDSKLHRSGTYQWSARRDRDEIVRTDSYGSGRTNAMHAAAEGYRQLLGKAIEVIPLVLMHGRGVSVRPANISAHGVHMATASNAMERIGNTLVATIGYAADNPAVAAALVRKFKAPQ